MDEIDIYGFTSYKSYLELRLGGSGKRTGQKKRAAEAIKVHTTLISQILKGHCELSLEQAEKINNFLGHSEDEANYFLLLVLHDRAGTPTLKKRFGAQLDAIKMKRKNLENRVKKDGEISEEDQERFYSSYIYSAIHVLSSIPKFNKTANLAKVLGIADEILYNAIVFMKKLGIIREVNGELSPGSHHVHLSNNSKFIINHHLNWRFRTIERIREDPKTDLHYSGVFSLSEEDTAKIKEILIKVISKSTAMAVKSREETACVFCIDFFKLLQNDRSA